MKNYCCSDLIHSWKFTLCFVLNSRSIISLTTISSILKCRPRNPNRFIFICLVLPHFCKPLHCPYISDIMHPAIEGRRQCTNPFSNIALSSFLVYSFFSALSTLALICHNFLLKQTWIYRRPMEQNPFGCYARIYDIDVNGYRSILM